MAFRLKHGESLGPGILRVYRREARAALKETVRNEGGDPAKQVHEVRKHLKKMRALLRLVRQEIGPRRFQTENRRLRDTGRQLSAMRDGEVRLRTFDDLGERFFAGEAKFRATRSALVREAAAHAGDAPGALTELGKTLEQAIRKGATLDADRFGTEELCDALLSTYKKGRSVWSVACEDPSNERLHELRKRTKDLWYDVLLLRRAFPEVLKVQARALKKLTTVLGDFLDLTLLRDGIPTTGSDGKRLCRLIEARQSRLQRASLDLGALCFEESPSHFAKRVAGYCAGDCCGPAE